jgi:hypothetical protein
LQVKLPEAPLHCWVSEVRPQFESQLDVWKLSNVPVHAGLVLAGEAVVLVLGAATATAVAATVRKPTVSIRARMARPDILLLRGCMTASPDPFGRMTASGGSPTARLDNPEQVVGLVSADG